MPVLSTLQIETLNGLTFIETDIPNTITFNISNTLSNCPTGSYPAIVSIESVERSLDNGGFTLDKSLNATLRIYNVDGTYQFLDGIIPKSQQLLTYNGDLFRIMQVKPTAQGTHFRIIAINANKGL